MASAYKATGINNLDFHVETETYYARLKQNGNTIRHVVGKNRDTAKKLKNEWIEEMRGKSSGVDGTLGSLVEEYYKWLDEQVNLQEIRERRRKCFVGMEPYKHEFVNECGRPLAFVRRGRTWPDSGDLIGWIFLGWI